MDGHTAALARACVEMGLVGELSSARLRDELRAAPRRGARRPTRCCAWTSSGSPGAIHPHLAADAEAVALHRARSTSCGRATRRTSPRWRLRLAVLARRLHPDELYEWFGAPRLRRRDADAIADAVAVAPRLPELLETFASRPRRGA